LFANENHGKLGVRLEKMKPVCPDNGLIYPERIKTQSVAVKGRIVVKKWGQQTGAHYWNIWELICYCFRVSTSNL